MKAFLLKVDSALFTQWATAAKSAGRSTSEWIRAQCNKGLNGQGQDRPTENSSRTAELPVAERRTRVPRGARRVTRKPKEERASKLCRHRLLNCTVCGN